MSFTFLQFMGSVKLGDFVSKSNISKALPMTFPLFMEKKVVMLGRPTTGQSGQSGLLVVKFDKSRVRNSLPSTK